jgi:hypothetical protein
MREHASEVTRLPNALKSSDPQKREFAIRSVLAPLNTTISPEDMVKQPYYPQMLNYLLMALGDANPVVRRKVELSLSKLLDASTTQALKHQMTHENYYIRAAVVRAYANHLSATVKGQLSYVFNVVLTEKSIPVFDFSEYYSSLYILKYIAGPRDVTLHGEVTCHQKLYHLHSPLTPFRFDCLDRGMGSSQITCTTCKNIISVHWEWQPDGPSLVLTSRPFTSRSGMHTDEAKIIVYDVTPIAK